MVVKAGGATVAGTGDFEGDFLTLGPGYTARIRPEGAYGPARYLVVPYEAAGGLWKQISPEKRDLLYKIINQLLQNSLLQRTQSPKIKVVRGRFRQSGYVTPLVAGRSCLSNIFTHHFESRTQSSL